MDKDPQQALIVLGYMQSAEAVVRIALVAFFSAAMILDAAAIQGRNTEKAWPEYCRRAARSFFLCGLVLSAAHLTLLIASPAGTVLPIALSGLATLIAIVAVLLERDKLELRPLGFLTGAIVWALNVAAPFLTESASAQIHTLPGLSILHITTALTGEALCLVAFSASLLYIWDYRRLKSHVLEQRRFMPSLQTLDAIVGRVSLVGFLLISTSLATGVMLILEAQMRAHLSPLKVVWAFAVWSWYLLALVGRGFWGWTGKRGAHLSIWGSVLLALTLFGTIWNLSGRGQ
ncbi:MAG: hypothetical protein FJY29_02175 [Betaproteobacteria bacterium]|nr:hypothetical protein [Betaproteobacteria bacterium]